MGILNSFFSLKKTYNANLLFVITEEKSIAKKILQRQREEIIFATYNDRLYKFLKKQKINVKKLNSLFSGIDILSQIKYLLLLSCADGTIKSSDRVLCFVSNSIDSIIFFDARDIGITYLKGEIEKRIPIELLESTLNLSFEIVKEGTEGSASGSLFVLGDTENVLKHSQQLIINPLKGHSTKKRSIFNEKNLETIKNFAQIDGATIINENGEVIACGRYINIYGDVEQSGLGCRHLAGISISKTTKAIVVVVSSSRVIRIFKDGGEIFKIRGV